jgi:hypothetical protein
MPAPHWKPLAIGLAAIGIATAAFAPMPRHPSRSVRVTDGDSSSSGYDREHAAALFVGVRRFNQGDTPEVPYAVDDAIDLAYTLAIDQRVPLVSPQHVTLALSGLTQKPDSQRRLLELQRAGATIRRNPADILPLLEQQASLAGTNGLLVVSIATHGFVRDGVPYVLSSTSQPLSTTAILNMIAEQHVPRSLIFVDACSTRFVDGRPGRSVDPHAFAVRQIDAKMARAHGVVLFSAVGAAYDDPVRRNGVFTATVIDGLHCKASAPHCYVTPDTLAMYVERNVLDWIRKHVDPHAQSAIGKHIDLGARNMPLAVCCRPPCRPMLSLSSDGPTLIAAGKWRANAGARITEVQQGRAEAVAGTPDSIVVFDCDGTRRCTLTDGHPLRTFVLADYKQNTEIVALWGSRLAIYSAEGQLLSAYEHPHALQHVAICRQNAHYAPKIAVTSANNVLLFNPKKLEKPIWSGHITPHSDTIESVKILDYDHDTKGDIAITTASGATLFLDFKGNVIGRHGSAVGFQLDRRTRFHKK